MTVGFSSAQSEAQPPFILSLDVGTSSTRALLYDARGNAVQSVKSQTTYQATTGDDGEVSLDPKQLVNAVAGTIDEALRQAGPLAQHIAAVATDTFWHSFIALDASGQPLTPVLTWADTRANAAAVALARELDAVAVHARTGTALHASYWPAKLRWLSTEHPDLFSRAARFVSFGEYLHYELLGRSICSLSMASGTGMLATRQRAWDDALVAALTLRAEQLAPLGDARDAVRGLAAAYQGRWPALRDVPWFAALGDGAVANVGSGCAVPERIAITVGTSSAVRALVPTGSITAPPGLWLYLLDANRALIGGALSEGGNLFAWLEQTLRLPDLAGAEHDAAALPPDGHGLTMLPFIAGERSLGWRGDARAVIAGIQSHTTPAEVFRAATEALSFRIAAVYERLAAALSSSRLATSPFTLVASGGTLLNSLLFRQILADAIGQPLHPLREHEASARGGALVALEALGIVRDVATLAPDLEPAVVPDAARTGVYREASRRQDRLYQLLLGASAV